MKLFAVVSEGDRQDQALITLKLKKKTKQVLNVKKRPFFFDLNFNTSFLRLTESEVPVKIRRTLKFRAPFKFKYKKVCYLDGYSFVKQSSSDLRGFLKNEDIIKNDAAIVSLNLYEQKSFTVKD